MDKRNLKEVLSLFLGILGLSILVVTVLPVFSYTIEAKQKYPNLITPVLNWTEIIDQSISPANNSKIEDYTKASNWFPSASDKEKFQSQGIFYTLSIPKLGIKDANVSVGGEDLSKNLIQYPGTALPGDSGNSVVFGHSVLPIFFDPKNYISIFSTLPRMKKGQEIVINRDGATYTYEVETLFEIAPADIDILEQNASGSYLTLITCVPPGDPRKPKRLVVRAKLSEDQITFKGATL